MPAVRIRYNDLRKVAVPHDDVLESAAIDLTALAGQQQQRRVDEDLLEPIGLTRRRVLQASPLLQYDILPISDCDVPNIIGHRKYSRNELLSAHAWERTSGPAT